MEVFKIEKEELLAIKSKQEPLRVLIQNQITESKNHKGIFSTNQLLGIKPLNVKINEKDVFALDYEIIDKTIDTLALVLNTGADAITYAANPPSWSAFFRGEFKGDNEYLYSKYDLKSEVGIRKSNFIPAIAAVNGFDFNDKFRFYILMVSKLGIQHGLITIGKVGLKPNQEQKLLELDSSQKKQAFLNELALETIGPFFQNKIDDFLKKEQRLSEINANPLELAAIMIDILNINRNPQTLLSDSKLRKRFEATSKRAEELFVNSSNCKALLGFIAKTSSFKFNTEQQVRHDIENILQERETFETLNRLYKGKNNKPNEQKKYIMQQFKVYEDTKELLKKI